MPVSQTCLTTGLGEFEPSDETVTRFTIWSLGPVQNMPISKLSAEEARRLQQVRNLFVLAACTLYAKKRTRLPHSEHR